MVTTIDKAGRLVVPAAIRSQLGLTPGTELAIEVDGFSIRLSRAVPRATLVRRKGRLVARPRVPQQKRPAVDVDQLIEEERSRWPV